MSADSPISALTGSGGRWARATAAVIPPISVTTMTEGNRFDMRCSSRRGPGFAASLPKRTAAVQSNLASRGPSHCGTGSPSLAGTGALWHASTHGAYAVVRVGFGGLGDVYRRRE